MLPALSDTARLFQYLWDGKYHTANEIQQALGISPTEVRKIAQENPEDIIGLTRGYKLALFASEQEVVDAVHTLYSRARKIMDRAAALHEHRFAR
jgi:predicted transcriptional regulator